MDVSSESDRVRLNLGAGKQVIEGYRTVDLQGEPDILADVRAIPLPSGSVDEILAIHIFEHLPRWDAERTLAEWHRVLRPGGLLVMELPDLLKCCHNIMVGREDRAGLWGLYGDPGYGDELMLHRWAWSPLALTEKLLEAGFRKVREKTPQWHKKYRDMRLEALA